MVVRLHNGRCPLTNVRIEDGDCGMSVVGAGGTRKITTTSAGNSSRYEDKLTSEVVFSRVRSQMRRLDCMETSVVGPRGKDLVVSRLQMWVENGAGLKVTNVGVLLVGCNGWIIVAL